MTDIPNVTVVIGTDGDAIATSSDQIAGAITINPVPVDVIQITPIERHDYPNIPAPPAGPLKVNSPLVVKPATVDSIQAIPVDGNVNPVDHLATLRAGETALERYRAVVQKTNGKVAYMHPEIPADRRIFLGIVLNPAVAGQPTTIVTQGLITNNDWNWALGPVHSASGGILTQDATVNTFFVGTAINATTLVVGSGGNDGGSGGDSGASVETLVWTPPSASTTWTIVHNLARYPSVTLADGSRESMIADITYLDINTVVVKFAYATSGYAYLV